MPTPFGTLYTSNITPDPQTGIGKWTADQFYPMMHNGRFPDGGLLYPAMPFASYTKVTREDSDAIYAYLRSIPPVKQPNRPHDLRFPFNNRSLILGWRTLFFKEGEYKPDPTKSAEWNRGAYLVEGLGHCGMCHTADQRARRQLGIAGLRGRADPDAELVRAVADLEQGGRPRRLEHRGDHRLCCATGVSSRGAVYGPMAEVVYNSLQYLTDDDTRAMAVYLKSLAQGTSPEKPAAPLPSAESSLLLSLGKTDLRPRMRELPWRGRAGHAAALSAARRQPVDPDGVGGQSDPHGAQRRLSAGHGRQPDALRHAAVRAALSDDEVAAVVTYIRTSWGNRGAPVSARQANELRAATLD